MKNLLSAVVLLALSTNNVPAKANNLDYLARVGSKAQMENDSNNLEWACAEYCKTISKYDLYTGNIVRKQLVSYFIGTNKLDKAANVADQALAVAMHLGIDTQPYAKDYLILIYKLQKFGVYNEVK